MIPTMDEIYRLVRALREQALPRNRHFEVHAGSAGKRARSIHRFLASVERDLRRATETRSVAHADGGVRLELAVSALQFRRTVELDARAHALLLEDAEIADQLHRAAATD